MKLTVDITDGLNWLTGLALLVLLAVQIRVVLTRPMLSAARKRVRLGLNTLLWLVLVAYAGQISWQTRLPATRVLLVGDDVPRTVSRRVGDGLSIQNRFTARTLPDRVDSVILLGQTVPVQTLARLSSSVLRWIPYDPPDQPLDLRWKGIVRQGEEQRITGRIQSTKPQLLRLRYGRRTVDSLLLRKGDNSFALQFPAFGRGRLQTELMVNDVVVDTLRFFVSPLPPLRIAFLLNNPDFESKTLADWLGKRGHTVVLSTTLSRHVSSRVSLNETTPASVNAPDLVITEPANAVGAPVRNALANGRAVLFINLTNPTADAGSISRATGSRWQLRRTSNQEMVTVRTGLTALPYQLTDRPNQFPVRGLPVAVQQTVRPGFTGRVGLSLLGETFPLALSGDSVTYSQIWTAVLARLQPAGLNNVRVDGPAYRGLSAAITVNNPTSSQSVLRVGADTLRLAKAPLNGQSLTGRLRLNGSGWQTIADSLAVYVADPAGSTVVQRRLVQQYVQAHSASPTQATPPARLITRTVPNWLWLLLITACLTALWIEPKLGGLN